MKGRSKKGGEEEEVMELDEEDGVAAPGSWACMHGYLDTSPPYAPPSSNASKFGLGQQQAGSDGRMWIVQSIPGSGMRVEWWPAGSDGKAATLSKVSGRTPKKQQGVPSNELPTKRRAAAGNADDRGSKRTRRT